MTMIEPDFDHWALPKIKHATCSKFIVRLETELMKLIDEVWPKYGFRSRNDFLRFVLKQSVKPRCPLLLSQDHESITDFIIGQTRNYVDYQISLFFGKEKNDADN
jgi:hypothetical protein